MLNRKHRLYGGGLKLKHTGFISQVPDVFEFEALKVWKIP
jgi:hypothetical protein